MTSLLQQRRRPIVIIVVALVIALVLEAGIYLGQHAAYSAIGTTPETYGEMQAELIALENTLRLRDAELAIQNTRHEVDRQALELVRKELASQNEEIAGLAEGLGFYRSLMSPGGIAQGLSLRGIELMEGDRPGQFFYRIVVQQETREHEQLKGTLTAVVTGVIGAEAVEYSLAELSDDIEGDGAVLEFRYFQSIEGTMVLPAGFDPKGVTVEARTAAPSVYEVRQEYPWQLEERFTHVGK